jgi:EF hand
MTQRSYFRFGLLALSAVLAAPAIHAQSTAPTTDPAQTAASQPASPSPQAEAMPAKKTWADLDIDKNGNLDKTEAAGAPSLQAVFDQADVNADGALTGEEYRTYLAANAQMQGDAPPTDKPKQ